MCKGEKGCLGPECPKSMRYVSNLLLDFTNLPLLGLVMTEGDSPIRNDEIPPDRTVCPSKRRRYSSAHLIDGNVR